MKDKETADVVFRITFLSAYCDQNMKMVRTFEHLLRSMGHISLRHAGQIQFQLLSQQNAHNITGLVGNGNDSRNKIAEGVRFVNWA